MKKEFIGYYNPSEKEINDAWGKGSFAFDTNTLLNLYRYTDNTRKDFLSAIKTLKNKLFLPHQAALEFHSNRVGVIETIEYAYDNLLKTFEINFDKTLEPQINQFKKHPSIIIENLSKLHAEFLKKISAELDKQKKNHPDFKTKDDVLSEITELFENCTGKEFGKEDLKKIYLEGKDRYAELIPPGFKDQENKKRKGDRHVYGDLIIWKELINFTKKEKKPLIFVTDDRKEDWWTIENGKTIRPREELIKEFFDSTGIRILIYNADQFLQFAKAKKLVPQLKDKTIKEVKDIRISDENRFKINESAFSDYYLGKLSVSDYLESNVFANKPWTLNDVITANSLSTSKGLTLNDMITANSLSTNKGLTLNDVINANSLSTNNRLILNDILKKAATKKDDDKSEDKKI